MRVEGVGKSRAVAMSGGAGTVVDYEWDATRAG